MKRMKKIFAVILSLAMVLGMSMTTFAAGTTATISVTGEKNQSTSLKVVRIVEEDVTSTTGWSFVEANKNSVINAIITNYNITATDEEKEAKALDAIIKTTLEKEGQINKSTELGNTLQALNTLSENETDLTVDKAGLYLIIANDTKNEYRYIPMLAFVERDSTGLKDTSVTLKGEKRQTEKTVAEEGKTVTVGETVEYTITDVYPYYAKSDSYSYVIKDRITGGTLKNVTVTIGGETATEDKDYTKKPWTESGTSGFEYDFGAKYNASNAGKEVKIVYSVEVTSTTRLNPLTNEVETTTEKADGTPDISKAKVVSASTSVKISKYADEDKDKDDKTGLKGAKFALYREATSEDQQTDIVKINVQDDGEKNVVFIKDDTTGEDGTVTFDGLDGTVQYYVKETEAPKGYSLNDEAQKIVKKNVVENITPANEANGVKTITYTVAELDGKEFYDMKLGSLPSTGGIGTTIFTIGGCAIMIIAAALFFASRRKSAK